LKQPVPICRKFFHALSFYRAGVNIELAINDLAMIMREFRIDPLLNQLFNRQANPEAFYIDWVVHLSDLLLSLFDDET
jgi:hypothetical protein